MEFAPIFTIATKEFHDRMRNRWVLAVALVFTVFSLIFAARTQDDRVQLERLAAIDALHRAHPAPF